MVEVHVGCVAANIPLIGPLFSCVSRRLGKSEPTQLTWHREERDNTTGPSYNARRHTGISHGFKRMEEYLPKISFQNGILPPVVGKEEKAALEPLELDRLGSRAIMVKTDLEQSYGNR